MKKQFRKCIMILMAAALLFTGAFTAFAQSASGPGMISAANKALTGIAIPADAEVLFLVDSNHEETNATGSFSAYVRTVTYDAVTGAPVSAGAWTQVIAPVKAVMGRKGMGKTVEGDEKTPLGMFRMDTPFGIRPPEAGFPAEYLQVGAQHYWSGDHRDISVRQADGTVKTASTYNRLVDLANAPELDKGRSEHLAAITEEYKYCINIGYNAACEKGKGSALFLHCINKNSNRGTGGCVAVDEEVMKQVLTLYKPGRTCINIR